MKITHPKVSSQSERRCWVSEGQEEHSERATDMVSEIAGEQEKSGEETRKENITVCVYDRVHQWGIRTVWLRWLLRLRDQR